MDKKETVLITGSSGYIGRNLAEKLSERYQIVGLDLGIPDNKIEGVDYYSIDMSSAESIHNTLSAVRENHGAYLLSVVHLVAYYSFSGEPSPKYEEITVKGTERFIQSLNQLFKVEQLIFSSTMLVHEAGAAGEEIDEESLVNPTWPYPQSKVEAEKIIEQHRGSIKGVNLRIAGVYDDYGHSVPIGQHIMRIFEAAS